MIKKTILFLLVILILAGCSGKTDPESFASSMDASIAGALECKVPETDMNNCAKTYYSYYKSNDVGKMSTDQVSNQFTINGNSCSLALDVTSIVSNMVYTNPTDLQVRDIVEIKDPVYVKEGVFTNSSDQTMPFRISVSQLNNGYFAMIQTNEFVFVSDIKNGSCEDTVYDMLVLLRTCKVDERHVALDYGSESLVAPTSSIISLFKDVLPESGYVIDYIDNWKDDTSFIIIDNTTEDNGNQGPVVDGFDDEEMEGSEENEGMGQNN